MPVLHGDCVVFYDSPHVSWYKFGGVGSDELKACPRCDKRRYLPGPEGHRLPAKIFYYIPYRDHVDALFCQRDIVSK